MQQLTDTLKNVMAKVALQGVTGDFREDSTGDKGEKGLLGGNGKAEGIGKPNSKGKMLIEWLVLVSDGQ